LKALPTIKHFFIDPGNKTIVLASAVILLTFLAFSASFNGEFIDDDGMDIDYVSKLEGAQGLWKIWTDPETCSKLHTEEYIYYPLFITSLWLDYTLWGDNTFFYHIFNTLLHALNSILIFFIVRRFSLAGGWLAALIFALHPVHVEAVAFINLRRDLLSTFFYFLSLLYYLRHANIGSSKEAQVNYSHWRYHILSLLMFVCGLLTKPFIVTLPMVFLVVMWWKRPVFKRYDLYRLIPFFALVPVTAYIRVWSEQFFGGARGEGFERTFLENLILAGKAVWFYIAKLIWPSNLAFIYPKWSLDSASIGQYLYPLTALLLPIILFLIKKRIGKGPLVAVLFFGITLFPALGFFPITMHKYTYATDHWQYLASASLIILFAHLFIRLGDYMTRSEISSCSGIIASQGNRYCYKRAILLMAAGVILLLLGMGSWRHSHIFISKENLYRDIIAKNKVDAEARVDLAIIYLESGRSKESIELFKAGLKLDPNQSDLYLCLAYAFKYNKQYEKARAALEKARALNQKNMEIYTVLQSVYQTLKLEDKYLKVQAAANQLEQKFKQHFHQGKIWFDKGDYLQAQSHLQEANKIKPFFGQVNRFLALSYLETRNYRQAWQEYEDYIENSEELSKSEARAFKTLMLSKIFFQ